MANFTTIPAELRERAGKGAARATRRAGKVPAVIYGAKQTPTLIALEPRAVIKELHRGGWRSRLYEVSLGTDTARALSRDVQFHPVTDQPEHVDFQRLAPGEQIRVAVAVVFEGEAGLSRPEAGRRAQHRPPHGRGLCRPRDGAGAFQRRSEHPRHQRQHPLLGSQGHRGTRPIIAERDFVVATVASVTQNAARCGRGSGDCRSGGGERACRQGWQGSGQGCRAGEGRGSGQGGGARQAGREEEVRPNLGREAASAHAALGRPRQPRAEYGAPAPQYRLHGAGRDCRPPRLRAVAAALQGAGRRGPASVRPACSRSSR